MAQLEKAKLQKVKADKKQTTDGDEIPVQFNPTSLKLKLSNQSDGGRSRGRQSRQNNGQSSTVLSMDLIFDSADEGTDDEPVSVRTKTSLVEQFVLPEPKSSDPPPLLKFQWDELIIIGLVESLDIEFDHFAATGAPLRAKMSVSIKEQDAKYAFLEVGKGQKDSRNSQKTNADKQATKPGGGTNEPGKSNASNDDRSDTALDGETAPDFLARQGLDPSAWRGLGADLSAGLSLEAGIEVGFSAGLNASIGVGVSVGVLAEANVSLQASLGVSAGASAVLSADASAGADSNNNAASSSAKQSSKKINGDTAGLALSAAGGVQAAIATVKNNETQSVVSNTQTAFGLASNTATSTAAIKRTPLVHEQNSNTVSTKLTTDARYASSRAVVDSRSVSYGYGVPLQPLYAAALRQEQIRLCPYDNNDTARNDNGPPFRKQKTTAPWLALPQRDQTRHKADQAEAQRRKQPCDSIYHPCSCDE